MRVWCRFVSEEYSEMRRPLLDGFRSVGIEPCFCNPKATDPVLVVFSEFGEHLRQILNETRQSGVPRAIALGVSQAHLSGQEVWALLNAGARDVLFWDESEQIIATLIARLARWGKLAELVESPTVRHSMIGRSPSVMAVLHQLVETAYFGDSTVLLMGESGTGKELAARLIHSLDQRPNKGDLIISDCTTLVPELSGSEFFGHERGAFTGAITARDGAFALANGGTLFLDEVGELPLGLQGQLLRAIQERSYKRVGGNTWHRTEFRLICATNRDLTKEVAQGRFRSDLYYRIAGDIFTLPPLRDRPEDILFLAHHFIRLLRPDGEPPKLDRSVTEYLLLREYPGNVRDLKQLVTRIMRRYVGVGPITAGYLPDEDRLESGHDHGEWYDRQFERCIRLALAQGVGLKDIGRTAENIAVRIAVADEEGNLQRAASRLQVTDRALQLRQAASRVSEMQPENRP